MFDVFYDTLASLGYSHPVHPVLTHAPIGLSIGALCLAILALFTRHRGYLTSARHAIMIAFAFVFLAIPTGIMDWQRYYGGAWFFEIKMKLALAALLCVLVFATILLGRRRDRKPAVMPVLYALYALCVLNVGALGFFGGQLVYRGFTPEAPESLQTGRHAFESHCSGCHRRGDNIIEPTLPLRSAPQLADFKDFIAFVRDPKMPDGSSGAMPKFSDDQISDEECRQLYAYIRFAFATPKRQAD